MCRRGVVQWQCPQGGYDKSADKGCKVTGVWREVWEEIGLTPDHGLHLVDQLKEELKYEIDGGAHKGYGTSVGHPLHAHDARRIV